MDTLNAYLQIYQTCLIFGPEFGLREAVRKHKQRLLKAGYDPRYIQVMEQIAARDGLKWLKEG